ncbi:MAG: SpoIID/LytB domain-containing protein [Hydrococcus sp. CRU_1_1]|nr:SpoIID/LytB domain-containing protein [Hydrococcus sp. CRU_1_1]
MPTTQQKTRIPGKRLILSASIPVFLGLVLTPSVKAKDLEIQVGIVQRFGEEKNDEITLSSTKEDILTLRFADRNGQTQTLQTDKVQLQVVKQPLQALALSERIVLGSYATFETAEDSANQWKAKGIEVEITQPERWEVWAKRDVYETPLLRRFLLQSLKAQGFDQALLESEILSQTLQPTFTVNGKRYSQNNLEISAGSKLIQVGLENNSSRVYGGSLRLQPNSYGTYTLVNQVSIETYLRGVVPHEIGQGAPDNAIAAQTIIARTYALRNLRRFQADNYQLCADTHCQVYYGLSQTNSRADRAIAQTKGLVLTYQNELVDALYSSTTGGITARFSDVWNGEERPYLKPVIDAPRQVWNLSQESLADEAAFRRFISMRDGFNETGRQVFRWNRKGTLNTLNEDLKEYLTKRKHPLANFTTIQRMKITKRSPSGRILNMAIQTDKGMLELQKNEIRSCFSVPRSTLFYIEPMYDPNKQLTGYSFIGGGFGHGVGLSQFGSYNLANLGWSPEQILAFYYPGTTLQPLNNSIVFGKIGEKGMRIF